MNTQLSSVSPMNAVFGVILFRSDYCYIYKKMSDRDGNPSKNRCVFTCVLADFYFSFIINF